MSKPYRWVLSTVLVGVLAIGATVLLSTGEARGEGIKVQKKGQGPCLVTCAPFIEDEDGGVCPLVDCAGDTCAYVCLVGG